MQKNQNTANSYKSKRETKSNLYFDILAHLVFVFWLDYPISSIYNYASYSIQS